MKQRLLAIGGVIALLGTTATVGVLAQTPPPAPSFAAFHQRRERHPELQRALRTLQRTKTDLQNANRDFGGHRAKAAQLIDQAIQEIHLAMRADRH